MTATFLVAPIWLVIVFLRVIFRKCRGVDEEEEEEDISRLIHPNTKKDMENAPLLKSKNKLKTKKQKNSKGHEESSNSSDSSSGDDSPPS